MKSIKLLFCLFAFSISSFGSLSASHEQFPEGIFGRVYDSHEYELETIIKMIEKCDDELISRTLSVQLAVNLNLMKVCAYKSIGNWENNKVYWLELIYASSSAEQIKDYLRTIEYSGDQIKLLHGDIEFIEHLQNKYCPGLSLAD